MREEVNRIYKVGYLISLVALTISLVIFFYFKSLNCTRITIHKNLFLSLAINNLLWIIWYETVIPNSGLASENGVMCRLLFAFVQYFMVATYFWMFCEGLYLHTLLVVTFLTESKVLRLLYLVGWGVPAILVGIYIMVRLSIDEENVLCWIHESKYGMIMSGPVCVSMIANTVFLVNIIRLLINKLHSQQASSPPEDPQPRSNSTGSFNRQRRSTVSVNTASSTRTQRAARATLILIPLLGLQYLVTPFRPPEGTAMEYAYQVTSALVASLQGLCVALLFCFFNGEVIGAMKKKFKQCKLNYGRPWSSCSVLNSVTFKEAKKVLVEDRSLHS